MWWKKFVLTAAYTGYSPWASGTVGTLVALALYAAEYAVFGGKSWIVNAAVVAVFFIPSVKLADAGEEIFGMKDPSQVVLDEVMGYNISVLFYPFNWKVALMAFAVFRVMDILKPYPMRRLENLHGGLGIMIDDCVAGIYTNLCMLAIVCLSGAAGTPLY
jgi:phosphatidylglycerophosphatase A